MFQIQATRIVQCFKKSLVVTDWPDPEIVLFRIVHSSFVEVGKQLGVSDNAVRKRLRNHLGWCPTARETKIIREYEVNGGMV